MKEWCIRHKYSVIFIAFLVCFFGYNISRVYGFIFFPDEFGYWSYAAKAAGYDWSDMVSLGSYYSYGYSLILFPIFKLCKDSVMAYRVAVTLNFVLLGIVYFMLFWLAKKLFGNKSGVALYAAIAVFYPSWLFYAKTTMAEIVLMTLFIVISVLIYRYLENSKLSTLVGLVVALVYIHFIHMRAIGILIAGVVTLFLYFWLQSGKAKQLLVALVIGSLVLIAGFAVKEVMQKLLYTSAGADTININDYAGQLEKVFAVFSKDGITNLVCGLAGKILYLGLASFGLIYWGIWHAIKEVASFCKQIRNKEEKEIRKLFFVFVILATVAETLINAIYNIQPYRVDNVVYGRYHEFVLPILMVLGLEEITKTSKKMVGTVVIAGIQLPMVCMVNYLVNKYQLTNIHGYIMVGMSYLYQPEGFEPSRFYWTAYLFEIGLTVFVTSIMNVVRKQKGEILLVLVIVLEFILSVKATTLYIEPSSLGAFRDTIVVEKIEELQAKNPQRRIVYMKEDDSSFISIMQFMLRDQTIEIVTDKNEVTKSDIVLLQYDSTYGEELLKQYSNYLLNGHFCIYYNP